MPKAEPCDTNVSGSCKAPPGLAGAYTRAECFACGMPTCTACSSRRKYMKYGIKRICYNCQEQHNMKKGRKFS